MILISSTRTPDEDHKLKLLLSGLVTALCVADDEGAPGCLDHVAGDDGQVVDPHDALDLDEQAVNQAEVAAGDAPDRRRRPGRR